VLDPLLVVAGLALLGSAAAGPAVAYGLEFLPKEWRRTTEWLLIAGAVSVAVLADLLTEGPGGGGVFVYVLAVFPGLVAFLAWRTLLASTFVSLAPLYFVIAILTRDRSTFAPELALDRALPLQPAWMFVYGSLYVFVVLLPVLVVRQKELFRRALKAYLFVMTVAYVGFLLYPTAAPRPDDVTGAGFAAWSLRLAYSLDPPYNCFPSLHVAYAFVSALTSYRVHRGVGAVAAVWAALTGSRRCTRSSTTRRRDCRRIRGVRRLPVVPAQLSTRGRRRDRQAPCAWTRPRSDRDFCVHGRLLLGGVPALNPKGKGEGKREKGKLMDHTKGQSALSAATGSIRVARRAGT
jgi:hypothetical protein